MEIIRVEVIQPAGRKRKSPGRAPGHQPPPRPTYPTVKKHASKKAKPEESLKYCRPHCCLVSANSLMI